MKAWLQRVSEASVTIDGVKRSEIQKGFLVLLGVTHSDTEAEADKIAAKIKGKEILWIIKYILSYPSLFW